MFQVDKKSGAFPEVSHFPEEAQLVRYANILSRVNDLPLTNPGMPLLNCHLYLRSLSLQTPKLTHSCPSQAQSFPDLLCSVQSGREGCPLSQCFSNFSVYPNHLENQDFIARDADSLGLASGLKTCISIRLTSHILTSTILSHNKSI